MKTNVKPHGFVTKSFHWLTAGLLAYGYATGLEDVSELADPAMFQFEITFALILGAAFLARLAWTKGIAGSTRLPQSAPGWEHWASRSVHLGLYSCVFAIVLSGLAIALGYAVPILSGLFLTAMIGLHEVVLSLTLILFAAHIGGALWHKFIRRDGVLESMTGRLPV